MTDSAYLNDMGIQILIVHVYIAGAYGFEPKSAPADQRIVTTTRSHSNRTVVDAVEKCEPTEIIRAGGAGHKVRTPTIQPIHSIKY